MLSLVPGDCGTHCEYDKCKEKSNAAVMSIVCFIFIIIYVIFYNYFLFFVFVFVFLLIANC